jgi:predicted nucleotidyltransferase
MNTTPSFKKNVLKSIKRTVTSIEPKTITILYGSQARGDANDDSDWDIIVIIDKAEVDRSTKDEISYNLFKLGIDNGQLISTVIYKKVDWQKRSFTPFFKNIQKEGIVL